MTGNDANTPLPAPMPEIPDAPETGATVTAVAPVSSRRTRMGGEPEEYQVHFDCVDTLTVTATTVADHRLFKGRHLDAAEIGALRGTDVRQRATEAAMRQLGSRPRSVREIADYLREKGYGPEAIAGATERLTERGYLDDAAFARWYAENRAQFSPRGPQLLKQELRRKGIAGETIEETLDAQAETTDTDAQALALARPKAESLVRNGFAPEVVTRRVAGLLSRRGYGYDSVRTVLRTLKDDGTLG